MVVAIPTVKSFCQCCELKVPCIVIASFRIIGCIIAIFVYFFPFFFLEHTLTEVSESENKTKVFLEIGSEDGKYESPNIKFDGRLLFIKVWIIVQLVIAVVNILFSYCFIRGAFSVKDRQQYKKVQFLFKKKKILFDYSRRNQLK